MWGFFAVYGVITSDRTVTAIAAIALWVWVVLLLGAL